MSSILRRNVLPERDDPRGPDGKWIKADPSLLRKSWTVGTLLKHVRVTTDGDDEVASVNDVRLVIATECEGRKLLGMQLTSYNTGMTCEEAQKLAEDQMGLFLTDDISKLPGWLKDKGYAKVTLVYDHDALVGLHVAELKCVEFSYSDHYQVLTERPTSSKKEGNILQLELWAKRAYKHGIREVAASTRPPLISRITRLSERPSGLQMQDGGKIIKSMKPKNGAKKSIKQHPGKYGHTEPGASSVGGGVSSVGPGAATMMGDLSLRITDDRKRKHSEGPWEDVEDDTEDLASEDTERKERPAKRASTAGSKKQQTSKNTTHHTTNNVTPNIPEEVSHIEAGSATMYAEPEGKRARGSWMPWR